MGPSYFRGAKIGKNRNPGKFTSQIIFKHKFVFQIKSVVLQACKKRTMYKTLLHGKEWHWRNVKMEAQEQNMNKPD
jgi:hypothetical protein